ncbi:hypothetical protein Tco_1046100 [Tanacetum coccineum]
MAMFNVPHVGMVLLRFTGVYKRGNGANGYLKFVNPERIPEFCGHNLDIAAATYVINKRPRAKLVRMTIEDLNSALITQKPVAPITHYQCPTLKLTNYTVWAIQTKVILEAHGLWEMIEPKENTQADEKKDKATIAFLYQALTEDVILQVAGCETAKELWESLKKRHVGEEKVQ